MLTLRNLAKEQNKTVIIVTHTTQNLQLCDKVIFMGPGGRLCFCGNVQEAANQHAGTNPPHGKRQGGAGGRAGSNRGQI